MNISLVKAAIKAVGAAIKAVSVKVDSNLAKADIRVSVKVAVLMGRVLHMIRTLNREITVMMETEVSQAAEISL